MPHEVVQNYHAASQQLCFVGRSVWNKTPTSTSSAGGLLLPQSLPPRALAVPANAPEGSSPRRLGTLNRQGEATRPW
jgi:hypothetical protein